MQFTPLPVRCSLESPLGKMTLAANDNALVWLGFDGQKHEEDTRHWRESHAHPVLRLAREQLQEYFAGGRRAFDVPLNLDCGTPFQQRVWQSLLGITHGTTCSYGTLSARMGQPRAVRAVGAAVGRNPISIIVPCHRVLGAHGALTGYAGGLERKVALLQLESRD
ncbi:MAG: methylated-DNA--[protein]-cysteine S-methyltransferase [Rhodoferax sp.]|nr:methylated-DNA--[protein]-cysteine S-methyltransferase [Rhodoferax sp.]